MASFNEFERPGVRMTDRHHVLTPEALLMTDTIDRAGSFAAAARELGKVPSALTYSVRQLEDALDVLLFDRSRQASSPPQAGNCCVKAPAASAWMPWPTASSAWPRLRKPEHRHIGQAVAPKPLFDLIEAFYELQPHPP